MVDKNGAAYLAASFVTHADVPAVATDYLTWLNAQVTLETAINSLLAAANVSKDHEQVIHQAGLYYAQFENDPPTITSITPATGAHGGTTPIVIVGTNLTGATGIVIGGAAATAIVVNDDTHIHATAPVHGSAATVDVVLTTPAGSVTSTGGFVYS